MLFQFYAGILALWSLRKLWVVPSNLHFGKPTRESEVLRWETTGHYRWPWLHPGRPQTKFQSWIHTLGTEQTEVDSSRDSNPRR